MSYSDRELVTVSTLIGVGGVEPMMNSHMNISLNVGITPDQLKHLVNIVEVEMGKKEADAAKPVLNEVLNL